MGSLLDDLRFGLRLLWRHPSFSILALLTLAFGIGANTAVFSIVRGVLFKPLPYGQPDRVIWFGGREARFSTENTGVSLPNLADVRIQARTLASVAAYSFFSEKLVVTGAGEPEHVDGVQVTANFFDVLNVPPVAGRTFQSGEDQRGAPRVAVISHEFWMRNFAGEPSAIGTNITLNSVTHQIVGVMPPDFRFPSPMGVWVPVAIGTRASQMREANSYLAIARLAPNATPELAAQELTSIAANLERDFPASNTGYRFESLTLANRVSGSVRDTLFLLAAVTALLLLIGSANVANLLLARATTRRREIAVRHALGAPRAAILRQLLAECFILSLAGAIIGCLFAWWTVRLIGAWNPAALPRAAELSLDPTALSFALAVSVFTAFLFGIAPALQAMQAEQHEALRDAGTRGSGEGAGRAHLRSALVVCEIALAVVLLAGAGLLLESLRQLLSVDPGFRTSGVITTEMTLPMRKFTTLDNSAAFVESYLDRLRVLPGVQAAGAAYSLPMGSIYTFNEFTILGDPPAPIPPYAGNTPVTPGYFEAMSIPRKAGRFFLPSDRPDSPKVIVISEPMAQQYFAGRDPLGKRLRINTGTKEPFEGEIVGVAGGVRHENLTQQPRVEIYLPFAQRPYPVANIVVRSTNSRETLAAAMKQTLHNQDRELPIYRIRGMEDVVLDSAAAPRARGFLTAVFAIAALLLASIGIYGVMSFAVSRRTQEIGIRMAVGASPFSVLRLILRESGTLVLLGVGAGLMAALVLGRLLSTFLFRVSAFNPVVLALVCLLLVLVAIAATSVPAWRAARVDPLDALRQE